MTDGCRTRPRLPRTIAAVTVLAGLCGFGGRATFGGQDDPPAGRLETSLPFIDEMLLSSWKAVGVKPSAPVKPEEYMRRAYLDIIGRIPTVAEAQAFLQSRDPGRDKKLIEKLLEHPDAAKDFGNQWTVLLLGRKAQERGVDRGALAAWLRRQYLDDTSWDKVVYELMTATGSNKENGAVNFPIAHMESGAVPLTSITTRLFLGKQIQCTQCHNHQTNSWKQSDFWGINAFFKGLRKQDVNKPDASGANVFDHTELRDDPTEASVQFDRPDGTVDVAYPRYLDGRSIDAGSGVVRRVELAKIVADPKNPDLARAYVNRVWGHFFGRGFVHPVDDFGTHNPASHPELLDRLAVEFQKSGYNHKALVRWITSSQAYHLSSKMNKSNAKDDSLFSHMALKPMSPEQLFDSLLTATSAQQAGGLDDGGKKRDQWLNQFIFAFANDEDGEGSSFQGTIPQALMMMNGELMEKATGGKPGSFLADLLNEAQRQNHTQPVAFMVNNLYLASLSRYPSNPELGHASQYLNNFPDTIGVLQDLFWALLNSNEFVLNR